jgi:outer membrane protein assembly factor BamE
VTQQTLTLTFDGSGTLTNIDNKPTLSGKKSG